MIFGRNRTVRHEQVVLPEQLKDERDRQVEAEALHVPAHQAVRIGQIR